ncbi:MAG: hypothetical protein ACT4OT_08805 [Acidobacteriota bacterium]
MSQSAKRPRSSCRDERVDRQLIGASRETVTRLFSALKRKTELFTSTEMESGFATAPRSPL